MPRTNLTAKNKKNTPRKNTISVVAAMTSSANRALKYGSDSHDGDRVVAVVGSGGIAEDPSARRRIWSNLPRAAAAAAAGEDDVATLWAPWGLPVVDDDVNMGRGTVMCVAINIWYVCIEARINRHASGMTGRPNRRVRFWSAKA